MTCIIGLRVDGGVFLAGDSAASNGYEKSIVSHPKLFVLNKFSMAIGYTTSFRMGQILEGKLSSELPEQEGTDDWRYITTTFIDCVRHVLKDGGYSSIDNNQESGGTFLVNYKENLYHIQDDFSVLTSLTGEMAIGSGKDFAIGSLYTTRHTHLPIARISLALRAATESSPNVSPPYHVAVLGSGVTILKQ